MDCTLLRYVCFFYTQFVECFCHERMVYYVKCFSCIIKMMIQFLSLILLMWLSNLVTCICRTILASVKFHLNIFAAAAKSLQSCMTLWDPIDGSPPGSPVPGILQARTREWVAISFSNAWKWKVKVKSFSHVRLFATTWTAAHQAPPSMGFSRQEYWSGVPLPSPITPMTLV